MISAPTPASLVSCRGGYQPPALSVTAHAVPAPPQGEPRERGGRTPCGCCAAVGSFAALRMRRTPCGCCAPRNDRKGFIDTLKKRKERLRAPSAFFGSFGRAAWRRSSEGRTKSLLPVRRITAAAAARPGAPGWPGPAWPERTAPGCCSWCRPSSRRQRRCRGWWTRHPGCSRS